MEPGIFEPGKDFSKAEFQQELNKWFESKGIITDLRSHLRHLMITALQNNQIKPIDGSSSPKAQALNLIIAEYLFKHNCHYTLSVFTSEVPTLANFNPSVLLRGSKHQSANKKGICFQETEVEEIFNALGMSSREEELALLKGKYLQKSNDVSLVELFLLTVIEMSTKLKIRQDLESLEREDGERLLSKKWSTKIADILLGEKIAPSQVTAVEESIFRITETEIRRLIEEERKSQIRMLLERERRIQEYLKKHEEEIFERLKEAEKILSFRKNTIEEELKKRQNYLTKLAAEWNDKHEEILRMSKNFHDIENENELLKKKLDDLEEENKNLKAQDITQNTTIDSLREEMSSLIIKLKEVTDLNAILSEQIQVLISKENKEVSVRQEDANQNIFRPNQEEIPLLWSKDMASSSNLNSAHHNKEEPEPEIKSNESIMKAQITKTVKSSSNLDPIAQTWNLLEKEEEYSSSASSSSEEILSGVRRKLKDLEEETNRINQNYLDYKLKYISADSCSESLSNHSDKTPVRVQSKEIIRETKSCQTLTENVFDKIEELKESKEKKSNLVLRTKKLEISLSEPLVRVPSKRQLQNRDFFLKNRELLLELEKTKNSKILPLSPGESSSFEDNVSESLSKEEKKQLEDSILLTPLRTASFFCREVSEPVKKPSSESIGKVIKMSEEEANCLALLEETRIKSPFSSGRRPLVQQILLSESDKEEAGEVKENPMNSSKSNGSPGSVSRGGMSGNEKSQNDDFW